MGSFGVQVGFSLFTNPAVPIGVLLVILVGILAGQMTYKWKQDIILTSVITVVLAFLGIWIGTLPFAKNCSWRLSWARPGAASPALFLQVTQAKFVGSLLVVIICYLRLRAADLAVGAADQLRVVLDRLRWASWAAS